VSILEETIENNQKESILTIENIGKLVLHIGQAEAKLLISRRSAHIEAELAKLKNINVNDQLYQMKEVLLNVYSNEFKWQSEIEQALNSQFEIDTNSNESISSLLIQIKQKLVSIEEEKLKLGQELKESEEKFNLKLSEELAAKEADLSVKLTNLETELKESHLKEIETIQKEHEEFILGIRNDFVAQTQTLVQVIIFP
jgi:hypothetical protein